MTRWKVLLGMVMTVTLATGAAGIAPADAAGRSGRVVGTDPAGDWNSYVPSAASSLGEELGQDLVKASIAARGKFIDFTIHLTQLPPADLGVAAVPTGYFWGFRVGKAGGYGTTGYEISSCEVDRDPCPGSLPDPTGGTIPFVVYQCNWVFSFSVPFGCVRIGYTVATTDLDAATITVPVSRNLIGAKPGTQITGEEAFGGTIFSYTVIPITGTESDPDEPVGDSLTTDKAFVVPRR